MPADAREMVDDLVGRLDLPQGATRMPRLTAVSALRLAAQAPRTLFGNLLDGRFRQAVARGRHAAVPAVLAGASQELLDLLRVGEIERFGVEKFRLGQSEFPGHRDEEFDQLALGQTTESVGMKALAFHGGIYAYCSPFVNAMCVCSRFGGIFATPLCYGTIHERSRHGLRHEIIGLGVPE